MTRGTLMAGLDDEGIAVGGHLPPTSPPVYLPPTWPPATITETLLGSGTTTASTPLTPFVDIPFPNLDLPSFRGLRLRFRVDSLAPTIGQDSSITIKACDVPVPTLFSLRRGSSSINLTPGPDYGTCLTYSEPGLIYSSNIASPLPLVGVWYDLILDGLGAAWTTKFQNTFGDVLSLTGASGSELPVAASAMINLAGEDITVAWQLYARQGPRNDPPPAPPPAPPPPMSGPYPPSPPLPPGAMRTGLATGAWNVPAEAHGAVNMVTVATPNHGGESSNINAYLNAGLAVIQIRAGPYGGGVQSINAAAWAAQAVAVYNANPRILAMEILNEPGGSWFWGSGAESAANAAAYARLIKAVRDAFNANGRRPLLLASYDGGHPGSAAWGTLVHNAGPAVWTYLDGVTVHPYGGNSDRAASAQGNRASAAAAHAATGLPVWITEVGWPTAVSQPPTGDSYQWTEAQQAANIVDLINWARSTDYVAGVVIFAYHDYGTSYWYGVVRLDDSHKTSYGALASVS